MNSFKAISSILKSKSLAIKILMFWLGISLIGPLIVHESNEGFLPALIPYSSSNIDLENAHAVGPFDSQEIEGLYYRHWLGTDDLGRDVLAQLVHASGTALWVGLFSTLLAALIGAFLGLSSAYYGDKSISISPLRFGVSCLLSLFILFYLAAVFPWGTSSFIINLFVIIIPVALIYLLFKWSLAKNSSTFLPLDLLIGRTIEMMESLPILFIIISLSAIIRPGIGGLILIIGISNWAVIAKYARAEGLKLSQMNFIESAKAAGINDRKILLNHILPNALSPILTTMAFGVAASILIEATLSFLGLGISADQASWGSLLAEARKAPESWWLALFPGLAIFLVVYSCNRLAERIAK